MIHGGVSHSHDCLVTLHSNQPIATRCLVCIPETVLLGTFLVEDGTISAKFVSLVGGTDPIASRMLTRVVMRPQNPVLFLFFFFQTVKDLFLMVRRYLGQAAAISFLRTLDMQTLQKHVRTSVSR